MKRKITKRDLLFFIIGVITMITIDAIINWDDNMVAFKEGFDTGFKDGYQDANSFQKEIAK